MNQAHWLRGGLAVAWLLAAIPASFAQEEGIEWRHRATMGTVSLMANILPSGVRTAFYVARGFTADAIRPYTQACGLSLGMQNSGGGSISTHLGGWQAIGADGRKIALRPAESWDAAWLQAGVSEPARIAFRWAQFQTENAFAPGDWIMGMATLESKPAAPFRLVARYQDKQGVHEIVLDKLECLDG